MASVWNKIDSGLALIYANYLSVYELGADSVKPHSVVAQGGKIRVELNYDRTLAPIERAGFKTEYNDGKSRATGILNLKDLEAIANLDEVVSILYGTEPELLLDSSVPQIKANRLWSVGPAPLFQFSGHTGEGVIVGIIDTGVDIRHPFLWKQSTPTKATRILRIWDMGLVPVAPEVSPPVALLDPGTPGQYGIEYKNNHIDDILNGVAGAMAIRHKDCAGHGTHVASTAAGDGRFRFKKIGVAPRADIIVVKLLNHAVNPQVGGVDVPAIQQFKDAITYIRKTADALGKPVVINCSFGSDIGPHDGLDVRDDWLRTQFADAASAGKICVFSAGNSAGKRQHATITFAAAGSIDIPFELFDTRPVLTDQDSCVVKDNTRSLSIDFYYPSGAATLAGAFKPTGIGAAFKAGPALGGGAVNDAFAGHSFTLTNVEDTGAEGGAARKRNRFRATVNQKAASLHIPGTYTVRLTASAAMTVHVWCNQPSRKQGLKFAAAVPASVNVEDHFQINTIAATPNIICVAAYEDSGALATASFSSRGPVVRHGVGGAIPAKPDIGAPGVKIDAAESADLTPQLPGDTVEFQGTSMAAPHVAGTVALMLSKKPALKPSEAIKFLKDHALKVPAPVADEVGGGRLDAENSYNHVV